MKSQWHLILATSFSMIATFVLQCSFTGTPAEDSLYQILFTDHTHDICLLVRSCILYYEDREKCDLLLYDQYQSDTRYLTYFVWAWLLAVLFYGLRMLIHMVPVFCTIVIAWLIARCCDGSVLCYPVDTITVHLLVWQCVSLTYAWQLHKLPWFSLPLHQGSTCVLFAFTAFYSFELCFRYLPVRFLLGFAWFLSIYDIVANLYPGSPLLALATSLVGDYSYEYARLPPGFHITHELDHDDDDVNFESIGIGDFLVYNWTLLFILPRFISIQAKTFLLIGHIISVQMGFWMTRSLGFYWETNMLPAVPCSVVFISLYALLIDHFYGIL